ncbi:MAG: hypothetical protein JW947_03880 [Sedimentisphaerales bacterium]|nr:hypothetical protein [Sedimentisphaerales bacterium]
MRYARGKFTAGPPRRRRRVEAGLTMVELLVTMIIGLILISTVGTLLICGNRMWLHSYNSAHKQIRQDAYIITTMFSSVGRKSNRLAYKIYNVNGGIFTPAVAVTANPSEVVSGDAVELRYWDVEFDAEDSHNLLDFGNTGTAYALFYLDGSQLKVDFGSYPPGGVLAGGSKNTAVTTTSILANNVSTDPNIGAFSHTTLNGIGQGSVRINIVLTDPDDNEELHVTTAAFLRNMWPR